MSQDVSIKREMVGKSPRDYLNTGETGSQHSHSIKIENQEHCAQMISALTLLYDNNQPATVEEVNREVVMEFPIFSKSKTLEKKIKTNVPTATSDDCPF